MGEDMRSRIGRAYERHLVGRPVEASLFATAAYFLTLIVVRVFTTIIRGSTEGGYVDIAGTHIHHLVFGVVAILVSGVFALDEVWRLRRAVLFGIGAALVLDEFALLVFLKDVYWLPQGSLSIVALIVGLAGLVVNGWRSRHFMAEVASAPGGDDDSRLSGSGQPPASNGS